MKKLTFKVSSLKDSCSVVSLIKKVDKNPCQISLDFKNNLITVENANNSVIEDAIELFNKYDTILNVDIDNTSEEVTEKSAMPVATETVAEAVEEPKEAETDDVVAEKQPKVIEPQSEDDLNIKKVELENENVENRINSLRKTVYWALHNRHAPEKDICDHILTCISEISMRFSPKPPIKFNISDIVDINFGVHLPGEINGGHVHAVVCKILTNDMIYVVPVTKAGTDDISSLSYLPMNAPHDATYSTEKCKGGNVLVDKGRYLSAKRFYSVVGKTNSAFFKNLVLQLPPTFDFTDCLAETVEEDDDLAFTMGETPAKADETAGEVAETPVEADKTADEVVEAPAEADETAGEVAETPAKADETADEVAEAPAKADETAGEVVETPVEADKTADEVVEVPAEADETAGEVVEAPVEADKTADEVVEASAEEVVKSKTPIKKVGVEESALLKLIGPALDKLDSSKKVDEQVEPFLTDIGMTDNPEMVTQAFIDACNIKKITYENVILVLHKKFPEENEETIKNNLKEAFKKWSVKYPTLAEECHNISLMAILKIFAKRLAHK